MLLAMQCKNTLPKQTISYKEPTYYKNLIYPLLCFWFTKPTGLIKRILRKVYTSHCLTARNDFNTKTVK